MKKSISKSVLVTVVIGAFVYGCSKNEQDNHSVIDEQDAPVLAKLQAEIQNVQSFNNSLILYQDSLTGCTDSIMIEHYNDMVHHYDSVYHHSESLCQGYHNQLNDIHHCDMITECESMMDDMMGNGSMMGGNGSHNGGEHQCDMMEEVRDYCSTMDELEQEHPQYCTH